MNTELKAMLSCLFNVIQLLESVVAGKTSVFSLLGPISELMTQIPAIVANWSDLMPEIKALTGADAEKDLVDYVMSQVPALNSDSKAQAVIQSSLNMILAVAQNAQSVVSAIKA